MKLADLTRVLQKHLPVVSDLFTDNYQINSINANGQEITVVTSEAHDLRAGDGVLIDGVGNKIPVQSHSESDGITTLIFSDSDDHGLNFDKFYDQDIWIGGTSNGTDGNYRLLSVISGHELQIKTDGIVMQGNLYLSSPEGFDGVYEVSSVASAFAFTVPARADVFTKPKTGMGGKVKTRVRIAATADIDRFFEAYTRQDLNGCWLAITAPSTQISRDRNVTTDAVSGASNYAAGVGPVDLKTYLLESVDIYAVIPASEELAGRNAADIAVDVRFQLYRSLCVADVPSLAQGSIFAIMPVSDSYYAYLDKNTAYTHSYTFERCVELTGDNFSTPSDMTAPYRSHEVDIEMCDSQRDLVSPHYNLNDVAITKSDLL